MAPTGYAMAYLESTGSTQGKLENLVHLLAVRAMQEYHWAPPLMSRHESADTFLMVTFSFITVEVVRAPCSSLEVFIGMIVST